MKELEGRGRHVLDVGDGSQHDPGVYLPHVLRTSGAEHEEHGGAHGVADVGEFILLRYVENVVDGGR